MMYIRSTWESISYGGFGPSSGSRTSNLTFTIQAAGCEGLAVAILSSGPISSQVKAVYP